uniref:Uncharacterized protein n=1 Tax=Ananas comosus var. bracteatus TaxID=296719 RepID=A0A6V7P4X9_ANACO|nr:unnamed protein product [Ananas comosus var. bracteatus]
MPRGRPQTWSMPEEPSAALVQPGASGDGELREQMSALIGVVRQQAESVQRQGEQIQRFQEAFERQDAAAQVGAEHPALPSVTPQDRYQFGPIFWRVVDSVPTYGSYPEICGLKLCTKTQKDGFLVSSRMAIFCEPEARVCAYRVLYRYTFPCTGTQCSPQTACSRRVFLQLLLIYKAPHAPLEFPELETRGGEGREAI